LSGPSLPLCSTRFWKGWQMDIIELKPQVERIEHGLAGLKEFL
jgi:hypothetical protein